LLSFYDDLFSRRIAADAVSMDELRNRYPSSPGKDFTRERILTFKRIVLLLLRQLKRSLSSEIEEFFGLLSEEGCSKQAFCTQRSKLKPVFFQDLNRLLTEKFYEYGGNSVQRWKGFRLWAIDGSTVPLPNTPELREQFGNCNSNTPPARLNTVYGVLNRTVINGIIRPYTESEEMMTLPCPENRNLEDVLLLSDRGYFSYRLIYLPLQRNTHFVMRAAKNADREVEKFLAGPDTDVTVNIYPGPKSVKRLKAAGIKVEKDSGIPVRTVKVTPDTGETEILITNLKDVYTGEDFLSVHNCRRGVETCYGYVKEELQSGQFSGIRSICIEQDFYAGTVFFNLQSVTEKQTDEHLKAVSRRRKYGYRVNKNVSRTVLKRMLIGLFGGGNILKVPIIMAGKFLKNIEPVRPGRKYPRIKKQKPGEKYYTLCNYKRAL
jgi:hypothetical protein